MTAACHGGKKRRKEVASFRKGNDFPEEGKVHDGIAGGFRIVVLLVYLSGELACRAYSHGSAMNSDKIRFLLVLDSSARPGPSP